MRHLLLLALALPACAQFHTIDFSYEGIGCASCLESLPARLQRMRGVDSAVIDSKAGVVHLKLAAQNRIRLELVRDAIEQDGTKTRSAEVTVTGAVSREQNHWMLRPAGSSIGYVLEGSGISASDTGSFSGRIADMHSSPPLVIVLKP